MTTYHIRLPDPSKARGADPTLSFRAHGADGFAEELQQALSDPTLFERWRAQQDEPDKIDPALGATDPQAQVDGEQSDLAVMLHVRTRIGSQVLRQRLRWLAGANWELRDVQA